MTSELETLLEKRKLRSDRADFPLKNFYEKVRRARMLSQYAEKVTGSNADKIRIKSEARRQFVISLVTALEVYMSDLTVELVDKAKIKYGRNLLDSAGKKYDIIEIREIFKNRITMGELICQQINFQNLDRIFGFLKNFFGTDMMKLLEKSKFTYKNQKGAAVTISLRKGYAKKLQNVIKMRHNFIHDLRFGGTPPASQLAQFETLIVRFAVCIDVKADQFRKVVTSRIKKK